jgi:fumarate hydratase, class I
MRRKRLEHLFLTVAVDSGGENVHQTAPLVGKKKIADDGLLEGV